MAEWLGLAVLLCAGLSDGPVVRARSTLCGVVGSLGDASLSTAECRVSVTVVLIWTS